MPALRFICITESRSFHEQIKNMTFLAGGALIREKIRRDNGKDWEAELEVVSEGGTLYRQVKELGLATKINLVQ